MALFAKEQSESHHSLNLGSLMIRDSAAADEADEPMMLACSMSKEQMALMDARPLLADRKSFFDHLHPMKFLKSTVRVTVMQATSMATQYMNDQFKADMERDELVMRGKMTPAAAESEADEWAEREWNKRIEAFPHKLTVAFLKYHSIMLVMRFYEHVAAQYYDKLMLDRLTMDTFDAAKRSADQGKTGRELAMDVYHINLRANLISYLADYSVHQVILCFGYYVYIQNQKQEHKKKMEQQVSKNMHDDESEAFNAGSLVLSVVKKSTLLAFSRVLGLFFSSIGSALGAMVVPSWGSLAGANLGDGLAMTISDDFIGPATP